MDSEVKPGVEVAPMLVFVVTVVVLRSADVPARDRCLRAMELAEKRFSLNEWKVVVAAAPDPPLAAFRLPEQAMEFALHDLGNHAGPVAITASVDLTTGAETEFDPEDY